MKDLEAYPLTDLTCKLLSVMASAEESPLSSLSPFPGQPTSSV